MKVLLVVHGYPPERFGGTETYTRWLAHALARRGHEVGVFTRTASPGEEYELSTYKDNEVAVWKIRNTYSTHNDYEMHYHNPYVEERFEQVIKEFKPDVVHFTYLLGGLSAGCLLVAKSAGIKTVVTLTDFHHLCAWGQLFTPDGAMCPGPMAGIRCASCFAGEDPYAGIAWWKRPFIKLLPPEKRADRLRSPGVERMKKRLRYLRGVLEKADEVIFPTDALAGPYRHWGIVGREIPFGLDYSIFEGFQRTPSDKLRLLFIGQLRPHKGLHVLTEALRGLDDIDSWTLVIYAEGNSEEEKQYLADSMRGLDDRVRYRATFDPGEIRRVYEDTDVLVVPSLWTENSPLVILYAMHTGTTLVAADVDGVKKVVGDWGLYYPPRDAAALRRILRGLVAEPEAATRPDAPKVPHIDEHAAVVEKIYMENRG